MTMVIDHHHQFDPRPDWQEAVSQDFAANNNGIEAFTALCSESGQLARRSVTGFSILNSAA